MLNTGNSIQDHIMAFHSLGLVIAPPGLRRWLATERQTQQWSTGNPRRFSSDGLLLLCWHDTRYERTAKIHETAGPARMTDLFLRIWARTRRQRVLLPHITINIWIRACQPSLALANRHRTIVFPYYSPVNLLRHKKILRIASYLWIYSISLVCRKLYQLPTHSTVTQSASGWKRLAKRGTKSWAEES